MRRHTDDGTFSLYSSTVSVYVILSCSLLATAASTPLVAIACIEWNILSLARSLLVLISVDRQIALAKEPTVPIVAIGKRLPMTL